MRTPQQRRWRRRCDAPRFCRGCMLTLYAARLLPPGLVPVAPGAGHRPAGRAAAGADGAAHVVAQPARAPLRGLMCAPQAPRAELVHCGLSAHTCCVRRARSPAAGARACGQHATRADAPGMRRADEPPALFADGVGNELEAADIKQARAPLRAASGAHTLKACAVRPTRHRASSWPTAGSCRASRA